MEKDKQGSQAEEDHTRQHAGSATFGVSNGCQEWAENTNQGLTGIHAGDFSQTDPKTLHQDRLERKNHPETGIIDRPHKC